jgi:flagellar basal-body rod modification protein FlgD
MQIDSTLSLTASQTAVEAATGRIPAKTLGQDDFLKLLMVQLTSQDPMSPMKDTEFIAQMAQFSALQQSQAMQTEMAQLQANSLIGRTVTLSDGQGNAVSGTVDSVLIDSGVPQLVVAGQTYELNQLLSITMPAATSTGASVSNPNPTN